MLVLGLSGSLRAGSYNSALLRAAAGLLPPTVHMERYDQLALVPPYCEDADVDPGPPPVADLRTRLAEADAVLIATPEYNASVPGQLKNALDWASRPYPDNVLRDKPAAVVGASTGLFGAVWAQVELRKILSTAGARVIDGELAIADAPTAFDENLALVDPTATASLEQVIAQLLLAAGITSAARRQPATTEA